MNLNSRLAIRIFQFLKARGVDEICVCPGARNSPLIAVLTSNSESFQSHYFFEERSAAFFALGRMRNTGKPVAVMTTSGTAAGELLPAAMEAHYSSLPLILLTADRPRTYRGSGAPQAAEQVGLFGLYVSHSIDLEREGDLDINIPLLNRPLHLNACMSEPLIDLDSDLKIPRMRLERKFHSVAEQLEFAPTPHEITHFLKKVRNPLVLVGMVLPGERESVAQLLMQWQVPAYLEGISGLREDPRLKPYRISVCDQLLERALAENYEVDGVIRIGGVPTLRLWRDLESKYASLPVLSLTHTPFSGLSRKNSTIHGDLNLLCKEVGNHLNPRNIKIVSYLSERFLISDRELTHRLDELLQSEPCSESGMIAALSKRMPSNSRVYLGNSLPIREWDLVAERDDLDFPKSRRFKDTWASRGVNGIDGQVSTFLGFAEPGEENWALVGDLTALYDLSAPWILAQLKNSQVTIVIVNNGGGKIFSKMFPQVEFQNQHQLNFHAWAELWGLRYEKWTKVPGNIEKAVQSRIIEMVPDPEATRRFWDQYQILLKKGDQKQCQK